MDIVLSTVYHEGSKSRKFRVELNVATVYHEAAKIAKLTKRISLTRTFFVLFVSSSVFVKNRRRV